MNALVNQTIAARMPALTRFNFLEFQYLKTIKEITLHASCTMPLARSCVLHDSFEGRRKFFELRGGRGCQKYTLVFVGNRASIKGPAKSGGKAIHGMKAILP
ncbi:hypothetical protein KW849_23215 [Pseudomonas sp. PDM26]|uniref:hypothetical protein n=1 Tax=Pseudomonas sp. PDM26 TaxID=2854766 RepID=UPI001C4576FF|nr:hypothetical protein [Pseudomonas sp. PDM26]MBV7549194.1 hypothetical protein [Pseudomonas sp. PDM26]